MIAKSSLMKTCLICFCSVLSVLFSQVHAESRFETGFRGMAWGIHKEQLPDLGQSKKSLNKVYQSGPSSLLFMPGKGNLALDLDGVPLLSIFMHFKNQIFRGVDLVFRSEFRERINSVLKQELGSEGLIDNEGTHWQTASVSILLTDRELMVSHLTF